MTERARFVALHAENLYSMTELCQRFGISRRVGYKWLQRFEEEGLAGLANRSRAPRSCPHRADPWAVAALIRARERYPSWGPKKLVARLREEQPDLALPAVSTAGEILKRHGLVKSQRRRSRPVHPGAAPLEVTAPNQVWMADFKGEFRLGNGQFCYPLTVSDAHTRYLLACFALPNPNYAGALPCFTQIFAEHGLPEAIRTDNGGPFSSTAVGGLSRLNVEWTKLGILHQRIAPGHPEQNGRHERMHRTLKAETARPPAQDLGEQQERFDAFRQVFNHERPHEALGQVTPASVHTPSLRALPEEPPAPVYPGHFEVRQVRGGGEIKFRQRFLFVSGALHGESVGLEEEADGVWSVFYYHLLLGRFREEELRLY
jgi:transposase InsO family protein